jgi:tetratricopeptide (TPR) repeat protein
MSNQEQVSNNAIARSTSSSALSLQRSSSLVRRGLALMERMPVVSAEVLFQQGCAKHERENWQGAIEDFTSLLMLDPEYGGNYYERAYIWRGRSYAMLDKREEAISDFTKALNINDQLKDAYLGRGQSYISSSNLEEAISDFSAATQIDDQLTDAYVWRGYAYYASGLYGLAHEDLTRAIHLSPSYAYSYRLRGMIYGRNGDYTAAFADLNDAIQCNGSDFYAYFERGRLSAETLDYVTAVADLSRSIVLNPEFAPAYAERGFLCNTIYNSPACTEIAKSLNMRPEDLPIAAVADLEQYQHLQTLQQEAADLSHVMSVLEDMRRRAKQTSQHVLEG